MANLPRELGQQGFGVNLGEALKNIGLVLGEKKRQAFVDQTLDEALKGVDPSKPETVFPNLIKKLSSIQNIPEAEGVMNAMKMGGSLYDMLATTQTHREVEKDKQFNDNLGAFRASYQNFINNREKQDIDTQRGQYQSLLDSKQRLEAAYPGRATLPEIPPPVGYGKKYLSEVVEKSERAAKLAAEIPMMDLKQAIGMRRTVETMEKDQTTAIQKAEDQILHASEAKSKATVREQFFPGSKPEEIDNIVAEAKDIIKTAKDTKTALHNNYMEIERRYQQRQKGSATGRKFTQKNTELSTEDQAAIDWVQDKKNEGHGKYNDIVKHLKEKGLIQ